LIVPTTGLALAAVALGGLACGSDGGEPGAGAVDVRLLEWSVRPEPEVVSTGEVTFSASNIGGGTHNLLVIRTDLDPGALPSLDDGSLDEAGAGIAIAGRTDDITPGGEAALTLTLEAGNYALVCNVIDTRDDGSSDAHYEEGMYASFTVE
jgi:uncharacterized cupredoxin-like copper-binding protein